MFRRQIKMEDYHLLEAQVVDCRGEGSGGGGGGGGGGEKGV